MPKMARWLKRYPLTLRWVASMILVWALLFALSPDGKTRVSFYTDSATGCEYIIAREEGAMTITPRYLDGGYQL